MKRQSFAGLCVSIILPLLFITHLAFSQTNFKVKGTVTDPDGKPLEGATVQIKGTTVGSTTTKPDGSFEIDAPSGKSTLVVSFIGFIQQELPINDKPVVSLRLSPLSNSLDDIVVVGYASLRKRDVTGSVAGINQKEIRSRPVDNAIQAMQGKIAGVDITSNERPGEVGTINIRGVRSLTASNTPLFVLDGIPLSTGGIEFLNPNDIETIDVLKDASATAIFGSRGANGVVLVTTKQGKTGKTQINLYSSVNFENIVDWAPGMSAAQYIEFRRWAYYYSNPAVYPRGDNPNITNDKNIFLATSDPFAWANINRGWSTGKWDGSQVQTTDWKGMVTQTGITQNYTLSVSGGTDRIKSYASFGYLNNKGTSQGQGYKRYTGKANIDIKATDWFSMGANLAVSSSTQEFGQSQIAGGAFVGTPASTIFESARRLFPYAVPYDSAGNRIIYPGGDVAFKTVADEWTFTQDQRVTLRAFGSLYAQLNFGEISPVLKGLRYRLNFGPDFANYRDGIYIDGQSAASSGVNRASLQKQQTTSWTLDNLIYYDKEVNRHSFGLTLLQSATKYRTEGSLIDANNIPLASQKWNALSTSNIPSANLNAYNSTLTERQLESYMARLNYSFDSRYLLTVSARWDGASMLAEGNKWSAFPSAALAWRLNQESFLDNVHWINDLKFRIGAGVTGNSAIDAYATKGATVPLFYPFGSSVTAGSLPSTDLPNQDLGWEKTTQYNIGVDYTLFAGRVSGAIDVYTSDTKDLLMSRTIPSVTGYLTTLQNIGQTANKGFDFNISTINVNTKGFQWLTTLNLSYQKDRIVSLMNGKNDDINNNWFIGQPIGVIYGVKAAGIWQKGDSTTYKLFNANGNTFSAGNVRPVDKNGDNKVDFNNDRQIVGYTRPPWIMGMTNTFTYKGVELSIFLYGRMGYMYSTGGEAQVGRSNQRLIDYYTENNTNSEYQKPIYTTATGDPYTASLGYKQASFIKIRNISVSYNLPSRILTPIHMSNLRLYFQAINPGMLYSQIDFMDMDATSMTSNRGFTFGINAGF